MQANLYALVAVAVVALITIGIGGFGVRFARSTSDFLVASRTVNPRWNAAAISGEYLSAASFLGIAGLVLKEGADALWYPVGFTGGYLALLLFVAAPLRRSGAYTLPDFAELRLGSVEVRRVATLLVVILGWLYLVPQLQAAGLTITVLTGWANWVGVFLVALVVIANVVVGGMRAITFVQAFQYWLKLSALAVPVFVLLVTQAGEYTHARTTAGADAPPAFPADTTVQVETDVILQVTEPLQLTAVGEVDNAEVDGTVYWGVGNHEVSEDTTLGFSAGSAVPVVAGEPAHNDGWLQPMHGGSSEFPLFATYSLIIATFLGTMGLPHVLVRYYTNPDGRAARASTMLVLALLGVFYLFPIISGMLARLYVPQLLVTGETDAAVLLLPGAVLDSWPARLLGGIVAAGAFAAFLSTASGLMVSVAGVLSTDVLTGRARDFRFAALLAGLVPMAFALSVASMDIARMVGLAFAVAASTFCPLLVLGIWWRKLTDVGAVAGLLLGGGLSVMAVVATAVGIAPEGWFGAIVAQPAAVTVPLTFFTMVLVSKVTANRIPHDVARVLARLHAPERLGLVPDAPPPRPGPAPLALPPATSRAGRHRR
ncbi:MAG TPA: cation acetate symporter [Pseudonocardiaceae bacterium]|nr:cation acetate symporter [Pseudonocardiaceae bacterium]